MSPRTAKRKPKRPKTCISCDFYVHGRCWNGATKQTATYPDSAACDAYLASLP